MEGGGHFRCAFAFLEFRAENLNRHTSKQNAFSQFQNREGAVKQLKHTHVFRLAFKLVFVSDSLFHLKSH